MTASSTVPAPPAGEDSGILAPGFFLSVVSVYILLLFLARRTHGQRRIRSVSADQEEADVDAGLLPVQDVDILDRSEPTAVFLVGGRDDLGPVTIRAFAEACSREYRQVLLLAVGAINASVVPPETPSLKIFERSADAKRLRRRTRLFLDPYLEAAHDLRLRADCRICLSTNPVREMSRQIESVVRSYAQAKLFLGKLVFDPSRWYHRFLHSTGADRLRESLERRGIAVTVLPVVIPGGTMTGVRCT